MDTSKNLHPQFKFNGLTFESSQDLVDFGNKLKKNGALYERQIAKFILKWFDDNDYIKVKTSGSTGKPKKIRLLKEHMVNSASATGVFFKMGAGNTALLCLPAKYIAGKMMLVRALTMGWDLHVVAPEKDAITHYDNTYDFAAMVPYQVYHSIDALDKIKKLIIGGGAVSNELDALLQNKKTEAFATYGMTESVTHIAVRRINGAGKTSSYSAMPDVTFKTDSRGCLVIDAFKVSEKPIITNDLVTINSARSFEWLGRIDNVVNSGGVKLFPEQIEKKIGSQIDVPFVISSEKDDALGERLILVLETTDKFALKNHPEIFNTLDAFERPKKIYTMSKLPITENGKIRRGEIQKLLKGYR
ncbi:AMP-binding protein [Patiriisocius marinus]|uniref:O-succinylbenzoic acid--CoA ligase n=1 Tax=Patiriisocius marinus TaxID=1397112 RepID=A0A5J4IQT4_9FLAO|nr:AMP-binding protein [Patiriisocius marinus]GER60245.1 O-succinylbenzoic acid--CoA ligase [Patiriisocius marinus]